MLTQAAVNEVAWKDVIKDLTEFDQKCNQLLVTLMLCFFSYVQMLQTHFSMLTFKS